MNRTPRAILNLQLRLHDLRTDALIEALTISEQAGPADRLDDVLLLIEDAAATVRAAIAVDRPSSH